MSALDTYLGKVVTELVNPLILLMSGVAFVVFAWGVFEFIQGAGDEKKRQEGRQAIMWGLIGLVIIFGAYGILNVALGTFGLDTIQTTLPTPG